jgi:peptide/nickel transport system permease protein
MRGRTAGALFYIAIAYLAILGAASLAAPWVAPQNPTVQDLERRFAPPSAAHPLGTDNFGRDILSRVIFGSRAALLVGIVSVSIAALLGSAVGLAAALSGGFTDNALMLLMDSLLSFPTVLLAIAVVSFMGYGITQVMVAIGAIYSPTFARLVRAETLALTVFSFNVLGDALSERLNPKL